MRRVLQFLRQCLTHDLWSFPGNIALISHVLMLLVSVWVVLRMALSMVQGAYDQVCYNFVGGTLLGCVWMVLTRLDTSHAGPDGIRAHAGPPIWNPVLTVQRVECQGGVWGLRNLHTLTWVPLEEGDMFQVLAPNYPPKDEESPDDPC